MTPAPRAVTVLSVLRLPFEIEARSGLARAGKMKTLHGVVETPVFMPVGTQATVKAQNEDSLRTAGAPVLLANTYHLMRRPGPEVFTALGGLHRFMHWDGPILTDSGGFQVFSLSAMVAIDEEGANFRFSPSEPTRHLSPESSIQMQRTLGSDIMMAFDECVSSVSSKEVALNAVERTTRWAARSLEARGDSPQSLFGIVQGACYPDLREMSAAQITALPFDGFAIGGLAVGETREEREVTTRWVANLLPADRPRYLMGVGTPADLLTAVGSGVDMFDCILPGAMGQQGVAYTSVGKVDLRRAIYRISDKPLDPNCDCSTCTRYSRAYLLHLTKCRELLGWHLIGFHNLYFYNRLMKKAREAIVEDRYAAFFEKTLAEVDGTDEENPPVVEKARSRKERPLELGEYTVVIRENGEGAIKHVGGETMHSSNSPEVEANELYIQQSRLRERLKDPGAPLVIWDVGLGAATNAMGVVQCAEQAFAEGEGRPVHIVSFEIDLDPLRLALAHPGRFAQMKHAAPSTLLHTGEWRSKQHPILWQLLQGDFMETLANAPAPDIIFYDPFSYKTDSLLWSLKCFDRIFDRCAGRPVALFTYSASTAARAGFLAAGFYVAKGQSTGGKTETTIAFTPEARGFIEASQILDQRWKERWQRSDARVPALSSQSETSRILKLVSEHPQWR